MINARSLRGRVNRDSPARSRRRRSPRKPALGTGRSRCSRSARRTISTGASASRSRRISVRRSSPQHAGVGVQAPAPRSAVTADAVLPRRASIRASTNQVRQFVGSSTVAARAATAASSSAPDSSSTSARWRCAVAAYGCRRSAVRASFERGGQLSVGGSVAARVGRQRTRHRHGDGGERDGRHQCDDGTRKDSTRRLLGVASGELPRRDRRRSRPRAPAPQRRSPPSPRPNRSSRRS